MKLRSFLSVAAAVVAVTGASACGGSDDASDSAATMVPVTTVAPTTTVLATTDVSTTAVSTTVVSTTAIATTAVATTQLATTVPTTAAPTTTVAATTTTAASTAPCDLDTIVRQTDTAYEGVTAITLRCAGDWASWVGQPDDATASDGFFAVAQWNGSTWELANLGTAGICGDGGVPADLWDALGCVE